MHLLLFVRKTRWSHIARSDLSNLPLDQTGTRVGPDRSMPDQSAEAGARKHVADTLVAGSVSTTCRSPQKGSGPHALQARTPFSRGLFLREVANPNLTNNINNPVGWHPHVRCHWGPRGSHGTEYGSFPVGFFSISAFFPKDLVEGLFLKALGLSSLGLKHLFLFSASTEAGLLFHLALPARGGAALHRGAAGAHLRPSQDGPRAKCGAYRGARCGAGGRTAGGKERRSSSSLKVFQVQVPIFIAYACQRHACFRTSQSSVTTYP